MSNQTSKPKSQNAPCWNCRDNATERLKQMFVDLVQKPRIEKQPGKARRAVFRKQHGIAYGRLIINPDIDPAFKHGIFAGTSYECVARFSSDTAPNSPDLKSTLGIGIKLFGVAGAKLQGAGETADFIVQNMDRFFVRNAQQMCEFTTAGVVEGDYPSYLDAHPDVAAILDAMEKVEGSCLTAHYWAILPFRLGESEIVKYRLVPDSTPGGAPFDNRDYLAKDLQCRLRNSSASFRFEVQRRLGDDMPLDDSMAVWSEDVSPYQCIARLEFPQQDICAIGQEAFGQNLSFNIWRTLAAHEPLGSIAAARKLVYAASAQTRHQANGQLEEEPGAINPPFDPHSGADDDCIVSAAIYPAIGVMRVGNSKEEFFIGPEVNNPPAQTEDDAYRDASGALKRQAARFRVYGLNAAGKTVCELTSENAELVWNAHLANQKSSWYEFQLAMDIPEAADAPPSLLRNNDVADRSRLLIDGGSQHIQGVNADGSSSQFIGHFMGHEVYLGEMRTDDKGRLLMLGGHGKSANVKGDLAVTFANNAGWYDDIADGPVTAQVCFEGRELSVKPAWVVSAPPDYAPLQKSVRTMWDLMRDVAIKGGMLPRPVRPSFTEDILPIFQRMTNLQWVNAGFAAAFGWRGPFDFTTPEWIVRLSEPSSANYEMRRTLANNFRRPNGAGANAAQLWPWLYGDAMNIPASDSPRQNATLSDLQLAFLDQWVEGDFDADYTQPQELPVCIDELPVARQADMLTRAALEFCLADAFHPGCEMTWPVRSAGMYMDPFRFKHARSTAPFDGCYYGPILNQDVLSLAAGPLKSGQVAGGITRWMAIPWQCDTASCRDGYQADYDPYLPTFWPARVPNNMLGETMYQRVRNTTLSDRERNESFAYRKAWLDDLPIQGAVTYTKQMNSMVDHFDRLAVVQARPGVDDNPAFPREMQVGLTPAVPAAAATLSAVADGGSMHGETLHRRVDLSTTEKAQRLRRR